MKALLNTIVADLLDKPLHLAIVILLAIVGSLYYYTGQQQQRYDAAATAYLQRALTDIGSWQAPALQRQLAPEARAAASAEQVEALMQRYRPLGAFQQLQEVKFARLSAVLTLLSSNTLLSYNANARFANGSAHLTATLILRDGQFQLYNFNLSSPQLGRSSD
jgi:hypothetical protein